jgi:hypothetical protein
MDVNTIDNRGKAGILVNDKINFWLNYPEEFEGEVDAAPSALQVSSLILTTHNN